MTQNFTLLFYKNSFLFSHFSIYSRIRNNYRSICTNPKISLCDINRSISMVSLKNYLGLFHNVLLLQQLAKRLIFASSSRLQKEEKLASFFENEKMLVKT